MDRKYAPDDLADIAARLAELAAAEAETLHAAMAGYYAEQAEIAALVERMAAAERADLAELLAELEG